MATENTLNKCRKLCREYKINYRFLKKFPYEAANGYARPAQGFVCIDKTISNREFVTALFHEIQHVLNYRNKKYFKFHSCNDKKTMMRWALRAEVYTDQQAKKLAKEHGFKHYQITYKMNNYWKNWLKEFYA